MENYKKGFDKGSERELDERYMKAKIKHQSFSKKTAKEWHNLTEEEKKSALRKIKELKKEFQKFPTRNPMDDKYKRIQYVRYADDFIIGVIGSKNDAEQIKTDVGRFLSDELKLEMSKEKTLITSSKDKARFLGYDVTINNDNSMVKVKGKTSRIYTYKVKLYLPKDKWMGKLSDYGVLKIISKPGQNEIWKP